MGRSTAEYAFKRDNALVEILRECKGRENCKKANELAKLLWSKGYSDKSASIHTIVSRIKKERTLPICFCADGYFWATTRSEIENTVAELESRRAALQEHIDHLKQFLVF